MRQRGALLTVWVALASVCARPGSEGNPTERAPSPQTHVGPATRPCGRPPDDAALVFDGARCSWSLTVDREGARLRSHDPSDPHDARGAIPASCTPPSACDYEGLLANERPFVIATRPSPHSDVPQDAHLGFVQGQRFAFVDVWAGEDATVTGDAVILGPAWGLSPFSCGDKGLAFFATPRLHGSDALEPTPTLREREGSYRIDGDTVAHVPMDATARARCTALPVPLP